MWLHGAVRLTIPAHDDDPASRVLACDLAAAADLSVPTRDITHLRQVCAVFVSRLWRYPGGIGSALSVR